MHAVQEQNRDRAMTQAKVALMTNAEAIFFTTVFFSLKQIWDDAIPTACTNGLNVKFNTQFFMDLDSEERIFLILHETLHAAFLHMTRLEGRNMKKWNMAADYVINNILIKAGFKMPKGGLYDPQYDGMSAEEVYDLLPDMEDDPDYDSDLQAPGDGELQDEEATREAMDEILVRAKVQSDMEGQDPGLIPGQIRRYIEKLTNPKLPWHRIFSKYLNHMIKEDYTFRKPNRRFFPDHILPTPYSEGLGEIGAAIDTSCSVSDERFAHCVSELYPILKHLHPKKLTLVQFDFGLKSIEPLRSVSDLKKIEFTGKGGTDIYDLIQWTHTNKLEVLVIFTDGEFTFHEGLVPACPVVWIIYDNTKFNPPYGRVIELT